MFVNGDFVKSESEFGQARWLEFYKCYMEHHLRGKELAVWLRHAFHDDKPAKLSYQQKWLADAGFADFGILWQKRNLAVYFAKK